MKQNIAIIGGGMAGLAATTALAPHAAVSLFDKSRGLSGRMSTRLSRYDGVAFAFDHGAQYFRAADSAFIDWLAPLQQTGHVHEWQPRAVVIDGQGGITAQTDARAKYVFAPGMNAIGKTLLAGRPQVKLYLDCQIDGLQKTDSAWQLSSGDDDFGPFDAVVLAIPAHQAAALVPEAASFAADLGAVTMLGCHTLMLGYEAAEQPDFIWDYAHFDDAMLGFAAVNHRKPKRNDPKRNDKAALVVQTRHDWSQAHIEDEVAEVAAQMKARFTQLTGLSVAASGYDRIHRWRYASTEKALGQPYLWDDALQLGAIGDWCTGSKVEDAFMSGHRMAAALLAQ